MIQITFNAFICFSLVGPQAYKSSKYNSYAGINRLTKSRTYIQQQLQQRINTIEISITPTSSLDKQGKP